MAVNKSAKIARVTAIPVNVPVTFDHGGVRKEVQQLACLVEIETGDGLIGHGFTAITEEEAIATTINEIAGPVLLGADPRDTERLWERMYWLLAPRGQSGYATHAIAAIDIALWDLKGKLLGLPIWRLLGGARERVPLYATFGFGFLDRDALPAVARAVQAEGFGHLKLVVGHSALARRDERPLDGVVAEDIARVRTVRDAIGSEAGLYIDGNCSLEAFHAERLARGVLPCDVAFFEEPVTGNDPAHMADLRRRTGIAVAAGQNEGQASRFRDFLLAEAVDVVQPNVVITGGFTQCAKIAGMAQAFNVGMANGGAFPLHNMHLHGGLANGGRVEWHLVAVAMMHTLYEGVPVPADGYLPLPTRPGLGFEPRGRVPWRGVGAPVLGSGPRLIRRPRRTA